MIRNTEIEMEQQLWMFRDTSLSLPTTTRSNKHGFAAVKPDVP